MKIIRILEKSDWKWIYSQLVWRYSQRRREVERCLKTSFSLPGDIVLAKRNELQIIDRRLARAEKKWLLYSSF